MRSFPVEVTAELEKAVKHIQHLFTINFSSGTIYWTDSSESIYYNGHWYMAKGITFDQAIMTLASQIDSMSLTVCNVEKGISDRALSENIKGRAITIQRILLDMNYAVIGAPITIFVGFLDAVKGDRKKANIEVLNHLIKWKTQTPKRQHPIQCPWGFKSTECGYNGTVIMNPESDNLGEWDRSHGASNYRNVDDYLTDLTMGGTFTADSDDGAGHVIANAFDDDNGTYWQSDTSFPHWVKCQFAVAKIISQYSLHPNTESNSPIDFVLQGSNNDIGWDDLDIRLGVVWNEGGEVRKKTFDVPITGSYIFYRIWILRVYNNGPDVDLKEVELIGDEDQVNDVDYNYTSNVAQKADTFNWPGVVLAEDAFDVVLGIFVRASQVTADARTLKGILKIGGSYYLSDPVTPATTLTGYLLTWPLNPITGLAWTPEELLGEEGDDLCVGGTATASSEDGANTADKAFDDDTPYWRSVGDVPQWLKYELDVATVVVRYTIQVWGNNGCPANFTLQGSNNDADWYVLNTQTGITWAAGEKKSFSFVNSTAYKFYKLNVTATTGSIYVAVQEMELFDFAPVETFGYLTPADAGGHTIKASECYAKVTSDADWCDFTKDRCKALNNYDNYGGFVYMGEMAVKEFWWGSDQKLFTGPY